MPSSLQNQTPHCTQQQQQQQIPPFATLPPMCNHGNSGNKFDSSSDASNSRIDNKFLPDATHQAEQSSSNHTKYLRWSNLVSPLMPSAYHPILIDSLMASSQLLLAASLVQQDSQASSVAFVPPKLYNKSNHKLQLNPQQQQLTSKIHNKMRRSLSLVADDELQYASPSVRPRAMSSHDVQALIKQQLKQQQQHEQLKTTTRAGSQDV